MEKKVRRIVWLMLGIILTYIAVAVGATGEFKPSCLYDAGQIDEIYPFVLQTPDIGLEYQQPGDLYFTVTDDCAMKYLPITNKTWKYIVVDVAYLNRDVLELDMIACDEYWNPLQTQKLSVKSGKQIFNCELPKSNNLILKIENQAGVQFRINELQFRKKLFQADKRNMLFAGSGMLLVYVGITIIVISVKRRKEFDILKPIRKTGRKIFGYYLTFIEMIGNNIYKYLPGIYNQTLGSVIRIVVLSAWLLTEIFLRGMGLRSKVIPFHYIAVIIVLLCFMITTKGHEKKKHNWRNLLVYSQFWLAILMTISGIIVEKKWPGIGLMFLGIYAVWFWVWRNMSNPQIVLRDIAYSVKIVFWITTVLSIFARTYMTGVPYSGIYKNQNVFVAFLNMVLAVELSQIYDLLKKEKVNFVQYIFQIAEFCITVFFIIKTQSRGGVLAAGMMFCLFGIVFLFGRGWNKKGKRCFVLLVILLFLPMCWLIETTMLQIQQAFSMRIEYPVASEEEQFLDDRFVPGEMVYAGETTNHLTDSFKGKSLDALTSGRVTIWKAYIRNLNLWGHYNKEYTNGISIHSHNAFTYIAYLYGIFAIIPYSVMWLMFFVRAARYAKKRQAYSFFPLILASGFFVQAMTDTLEEPFAMESWMIIYIVIGILYDNRQLITD